MLSSNCKAPNVHIHHVDCISTQGLTGSYIQPNSEEIFLLENNTEAVRADSDDVDNTNIDEADLMAITESDDDSSGSSLITEESVILSPPEDITDRVTDEETQGGEPQEQRYRPRVINHH